MYASTVEREQTSTSCNILWPESEHISGQAAFTLYSFILGFAIPLLLIFVFYFLVIRKLKTVGPKNKSKEKKKSHRKVTKLVLTVIAVYVLCWLPYWITQVREASVTLHFGIYLFLLYVMMLSVTHGPKRDEVIGGWRKLHNEELHNLYCSPSIIIIMKSRRMRWAGHVASMEKKRDAYRILVGKPEGKRRLGRPRHRWEDNSKMDLREIGWGGMDWIDLAQDRD
jgi:uncharacterized membrane protein YciS (DUF1049 family)